MKAVAQGFALGGQAFGRWEDGRIVFLEGMLPGEEAEVEVIQEKKDFLRAKVVCLTKTSPFRVEPPCPYFGQCGGCSLMTLSYEEQVRQKDKLLKEAVSRAQENVNYLPPVCGEPLGYRTRARFHCKMEKGQLKLGFLKENSSEVVFPSSCPVLHDKLGQLMKEPPKINLWELKDKQLPCVLADDGVAFDSKVHWVTVGSRKLPLTSQVFFQSNLSLLPALIDYVGSLVKGPRVMDLYSGVGTFSAFLEDNFDVTAVEIDKKCLELSKMHLKRTKFFTSPVEKWNYKTPVDTVIVDPPRVGLDRAVPAMISKWNPLRIIYVSCALPTLSRDLISLTKEGYTIESARLFEFNPGVFHTETVVMLS
ncbi:MAG: class I SAM-dependent RNA methyltransferase, partial [Sphaerochaetaceae bacterium]|nr:class I SAM-dependent RNA methyltransferase [Sphaerochaetaceae bacterium]